MTNNGSANTTEEKSPWVQPGFIAAGGVLAMVVLLGIVLAITSGSSKGDTTGQAASPPPASSSPAAGNPGDSVCGLAAGDQSIPRTPPTASWKLRGSFAVPVATEYGPAGFAHGIPSCFAHSPIGALFAAINIDGGLATAAKASTADRVNALRAMAASGAGRDAAIATTRRDGPATDTSAGAQVAGFSIVRYDPSTAVVDLAIRVDRPGAAGYTHLSATLRWERRDWKLAFSQAGEPFDGTQQIPSLAGYVPWSGV